MTDTKADSKIKTIEISLQDVAITGKYNPALFLPQSQFGKETQVADIIQQGLETPEMRKILHRTLLANDENTSDLFSTRNHKAADFKLVKLEKCAYCNQACAQEKLLTYFTLIHSADLLFSEMSKLGEALTKKEDTEKFKIKCFQVWQIETNVRDVRFREPLVINAGCLLVVLTRCDACMNGGKGKESGSNGGPKVEVIDE